MVYLIFTEFLVIAVLTSMNESDDISFTCQSTNFLLAGKIVALNLFDSNGILVDFYNQRYPIKVTIALEVSVAVRRS